MKKTFFVPLVFFLAAVLLFSNLSCRKKYEEDPWTMRFVNLGKRIEGEWSIQKILIDGTDSTAIIYVDSLQIFSTYIFSDYSHNYGWGKLDAKTYNNYYRWVGLHFIFYKSDDLNTIGFYYNGAPAPGSNLRNNTGPYGPINDFGNEGIWHIFQLTKKEMHLSTTFNSKQYELFFKKV